MAGSSVDTGDVNRGAGEGGETGEGDGAIGPGNEGTERRVSSTVWLGVSPERAAAV